MTEPFNKTNVIYENTNTNTNTNTNYDIETQEFMIKTLNVCNKYRSNTNDEISKRNKVSEELSSFLNSSNEGMIKTINEYKEEMNNEMLSNNNNNNSSNNSNNNNNIASLHIPSPPNNS